MVLSTEAWPVIRYSSRLDKGRKRSPLMMFGEQSSKMCIRDRYINFFYIIHLNNSLEIYLISVYNPIISQRFTDDWRVYICLLYTSLQQDILPIPKSLNLERMAQNADIFDFNLTPEECLQITGLGETGRTGPDPDNIDFSYEG